MLDLLLEQHAWASQGHLSSKGILTKHDESLFFSTPLSKIVGSVQRKCRLLEFALPMTQYQKIMPSLRPLGTWKTPQTLWWRIWTTNCWTMQGDFGYLRLRLNEAFDMIDKLAKGHLYDVRYMSSFSDQLHSVMADAFPPACAMDNRW